MELKDYQQKVIDDLERYLKFVLSTDSLNDAFVDYWAENGVLLDQGKKAYKDTKIPGVPNVCAKVPTAGGKTFIGVNAIKTIFDATHYAVPDHPKLVVWLVPSRPILEQTINAFSDPEHPYRKRLELHFRRRVNVISRESMQIGASFSPDSVKEELTLVVMTYASLRSKSKDGRNIFKDNGYLEKFTKAAGYGEDISFLDETDPSALINVIRTLRPVVIVDESHNAESALSMEMLKSLNPSFVFDLTATPKEHSNVISYISAKSLKDNNMVKLPVIVANRSNTEEVIESAIILRRKLEEISIEAESHGGRYIRPIVLFQAQPNSDEESITFIKIKKNLVEIGIPEDQIKIRTSGIDELSGLDLMSRDCTVRYILTVNALKEGWDCPFAYILASLASKSSSVDVEQVLGRVLRMPYIHRHQNPLLNDSYVFTSSSNFSSTLNDIVKALNSSGFSDRDYRAIDINDLPIVTQDSAFQLELTSQGKNLEQPENPKVGEGDSGAFDIKSVSGAVNNFDSEVRIDSFIEKAKAQTEDFETRLKSDHNDQLPKELEGKMNKFNVKEIFAAEIANLKIPQFVKETIEGGWFDEPLHAFEKNELLKNFKLSTCDSKINFDDVDSDIYRLDLEEYGVDNYALKPFRLTSASRQRFNEIILKGSSESQKRDLSHRIITMIGNMFPITDEEVATYVKRIVDAFSSEQIQDCLDRDVSYVRKIKEKIAVLAATHSKKEFDHLLQIGAVRTEPWFVFPNTISPSSQAPSLPRSLYTEEAGIGSFERGVIEKIANLSNVRWWHRNLSRGRGFRINGFINHYPDFIIMTEHGTLILVEAKGADRDNSNSVHKLELGQAWAKEAGKGYRYLMIFDANEIPGAYITADAVGIISRL